MNPIENRIKKYLVTKELIVVDWLVEFQRRTFLATLELKNRDLGQEMTLIFCEYN